MGRRPRVRAGFLSSWLPGSIKDEVVVRIVKGVQDEEDGDPITRALVAGITQQHMALVFMHARPPMCPLQGTAWRPALATLCAFDVATAIKEAGAMADDGRPIDVCCYPLEPLGLATEPSGTS
ncbi:TPA: hypothetical protein ACH3X2_000279 [Trebouxia sp. C0005]